jgi:hypothetical protein
MGTPPPFIYQSPHVSTEGKPVIIKGKEAETPTIPPEKAPCRSLFAKCYLYRKIIETLPESYCPRIVISHSIWRVSLDVTFTAGVICA